MRKHCRTRVRNRGSLVRTPYNSMVSYFAYSQLSLRWREWVFRTVSQRTAEALVAAGEAIEIRGMRDGVVQVVGYRATKPTSWERPSPTTLTHSTMIAVGKAAQGCRLTRRQRDEVVKFKVWPLIGDTRAVAVRPRISDEDRRVAENLLRTGKLLPA